MGFWRGVGHVSAGLLQLGVAGGVAGYFRLTRTDLNGDAGRKLLAASPAARLAWLGFARDVGPALLARFDIQRIRSTDIEVRLSDEIVFRLRSRVVGVDQAVASEPLLHKLEQAAGRHFAGAHRHGDGTLRLPVPKGDARAYEDSAFSGHRGGNVVAQRLQAFVAKHGPLVTVTREGEGQAAQHVLTLHDPILGELQELQHALRQPGSSDNDGVIVRAEPRGNDALVVRTELPEPTPSGVTQRLLEAATGDLRIEVAKDRTSIRVRGWPSSQPVPFFPSWDVERVGKNEVRLHMVGAATRLAGLKLAELEPLRLAWSAPGRAGPYADDLLGRIARLEAPAKLAAFDLLRGQPTDSPLRSEIEALIARFGGRAPFPPEAPLWLRSVGEHAVTLSTLHIELLESTTLPKLQEAVRAARLYLKGSVVVGEQVFDAIATPLIAKTSAVKARENIELRLDTGELVLASGRRVDLATAELRPIKEIAADIRKQAGIVPRDVSAASAA